MPVSIRHKIFWGLSILLSLFGFAGVVPVSIDTFNSTNSCPMIGHIPACYVVMVGYFLMLLSCFSKRSILFILGWLPVFLLAVTGVVSELLGHEVCPRNSADIPMCYFSLTLVVLIAITFLGWKKTARTRSN